MINGLIKAILLIVSLLYDLLLTSYTNKLIGNQTVQSIAVILDIEIIHSFVNTE